jgi:hypothetical protein
VASLHGSEGPVGSPVHAPGGRAKQFGLRFVAEPMNFEMCSVAEVGAIVISRSARGETLVALPGAEPVPMTSVHAGGGYRIQVEDRRNDGIPVPTARRPVRVGRSEQTTITPPPDPDDLL